MTGKKNQPDYAIALDLGTASVGWCALLISNYELLNVNGKDAIGIRLFAPGKQAKKCREHRSSRRLNKRKKRRISLTDEIFKEKLEEKDKNFLKKNKFSWVNKKHNEWVKNQSDDRKKEINPDFIGGIHKGRIEDGMHYKSHFHLRKALIESEKKEDIRDIYLAVKHIMKHRGHFLNDLSVSSNTESDPIYRKKTIISDLANIFENFFRFKETNTKELADQLTTCFIDHNCSKSTRKSSALEIVKKSVHDKQNLMIVEEIINASIGYAINLEKLFDIKKDDYDSSIKFETNDFDDYENDTSLTVLKKIMSEQEWECINALYDIYKKITLEILLEQNSYYSVIMVKRDELRRKQLEDFKEIIEKLDNTASYHKYLKHYFKPDVKKYKKDFNEKNDKKKIEIVNTCFNNIAKAIINDMNSSKEKINERNGIITFKNFRLVKNEGTNSQAVFEHSDGKKYVLDKENTFPTQRGSHNRIVPNQLHRLELEKILENQEKRYNETGDDFFTKNNVKEKLLKIFDFKLRYDMGVPVDSEIAKKNGNSRNIFAQYSDYGKAQKDKTVTPFNYEKMFDKTETQKKFIEKLKGRCTYLIGEETLPKHSLLYQEYEVLNEINNIRIPQKITDESGEREIKGRLTPEMRTKLFNTFKKKISVTLEDVKRIIKETNGNTEENTPITGFQNHKKQKFASSLTTYKDLKNVFDKVNDKFMEDIYPSNLSDKSKGNIDQTKRELLEEIIEIQTRYGDEKTRKKELDKLTDDEKYRKYQKELERITTVLAKKHYNGYGRLSKKLLGTSPTENGESIIDILRYGYKDNNGRGKPKCLNFMEIYHDKYNVLQNWINEENKNQRRKNLQSINLAIDDITNNPQVKRALKQTINVVNDIIKHVGYPPKYFFLEKADGGDDDSMEREDKIKKLFSQFKNNNKSENNDKYKVPDTNIEINANLFHQTKKGGKKQYDVLNDEKNSVTNDKFYLYLTQLGKDIYTGKEINLDLLHSGKYNDDHIISKALMRDSYRNSVYINRALTNTEQNGRKNKDFVDQNIVNEMKPFWNYLLKNNLINQSKYDNLVRTGFSKADRRRFCERTLVNTRQIIKNVKTLLEYNHKHISNNKYPKPLIVGLNSEATKAMRSYLGYELKNRNINDYHHAHDAYCLGLTGTYAVKSNKLDSSGNLNHKTIQDFEKNYSYYLKDNEKNNFTCYNFLVYLMRKEEERRTEKNRLWTENNKIQSEKILKDSKILFTQKPDFDGEAEIFNITIKNREANEEIEKQVPLNKKEKDIKTEISKKGKPCFVYPYGHYSSKGKSCNYLYRYKDSEKVYIGTIYTIDIPKIKKDKAGKIRREKLEEFLNSNPTRKKEIFVLTNALPKGQPAIISNHYVNIVSNTELHNAQQLCLDESTFKTIDAILTSNCAKEFAQKINKNVDECAEIFKRTFRFLINEISKRYPRYTKLGNKQKRAKCIKDFNERIKEFNPLLNSKGYEIIQNYFLKLVQATSVSPAKSEKNNQKSSLPSLPVFTGRPVDRMQSDRIELNKNDTIIYHSPSGLSEKRITVSALIEEDQNRRKNINID